MAIDGQDASCGVVTEPDPKLEGPPSSTGAPEQNERVSQGTRGQKRMLEADNRLRWS